MKRFDLAEPAARLWSTRGRAICTAIVGDDGRDHAKFAIGGGTILASRWKHRRSFDIDIAMYGDKTCTDLSPMFDSKFERRIAGAGGRAQFENGLYTLEFPEGRVEIAGRRPAPRQGHETVAIDGVRIDVLSTAQILQGKFRRSGRSPVRDVFDVIVAAGRDPRDLAIAVNAVPEATARAAAKGWSQCDDAFAEDAEGNLRGVPDELQYDSTKLGTTAGDALAKAIYTRLLVVARGEELRIHTRNPLEGDRTTTGRVEDAWDVLEMEGVLAHARATGMNERRLLKEIERHTARNDDRTTTIFRKMDLQGRPQGDHTSPTGM